MKRDSLVILGMCVVAIIVGAGLFFFGGVGAVAPAGDTVAVQVLAEGTDAVGIDQKNYRIVDAAQLEEIWSMVYGQTVYAVPEVDFTTQEVLAVFDGERPTGGYSISVAYVVDTPEQREITIIHKAPGAGCVTTEAITYPFQIVVVPKTTASIDRRDQDVTVACN